LITGFHDSEWLPRIPTTDRAGPIRWPARGQNCSLPIRGAPARKAIVGCRSISASRAKSPAGPQTSHTKLQVAGREPARAKCAMNLNCLGWSVLGLAIDLPQAMGRRWDRQSRSAPNCQAQTLGSIQSHPTILRPERLDPLRYIPVINVAAVDLEEIAERCQLVPCIFQRRCEFVVQRSSGLCVEIGKL
jgi:hypothetical protein